MTGTTTLTARGAAVRCIDTVIKGHGTSLWMERRADGSLQERLDAYAVAREVMQANYTGEELLRKLSKSRAWFGL